MFTRILMTAAMALVLASTACADGDPVVEPSDAQPCETAQGCSCNTTEDCPQVHISVWYPTCECSIQDGTMVCGDILQTPTGGGGTSCVEGTCQVDFEIEETDCAAEGKVCEMYAGRGTRAGGDACVDPAVRGGDACPITAGECSEDSECAEGQVCAASVVDGGTACAGICEDDQEGSRD